MVNFEKRNAIKSQVLADFIIDWTKPSGYTKNTVVKMPWQVYYDRAWAVFEAGVVAILKSPSS
jgi:hypothetical protein